HHSNRYWKNNPEKLEERIQTLRGLEKIAPTSTQPNKENDQVRGKAKSLALASSAYALLTLLYQMIFPTPNIWSVSALLGGALVLLVLASRPYFAWRFTWILTSGLALILWIGGVYVWWKTDNYSK